MNAEGLVLSLAMAAAAGLIGSFAVMRRMTLAADALSHVALPGIGIAMALHIHPLAGAIAALFFGAVLVWALEDRARLATETLIGVVFSAALALGAMITSGEDLLDALFGGRGTLGTSEFVFGLAAAAAVVWFVVRYKDALVLAVVSPDLARTAGVNLRQLNLLYMIMFALTIALGLRYLGVLLMGSLIIIPAATARRLTGNLTRVLSLGVALAMAATAAGTSLAAVLHAETGPIIVAVAAAGFFVALLLPASTTT